MGAASTQVLIDTPRTALLDLRQGTTDLQSLDNRALLLGNVMASLPVREYIARRAKVSADAIRVAPPLTPEFPRPLAETGNAKHTSDLLHSADQYRLSIQANPTVPVLDVHAQAPSAGASEELANAAVDGLRDYLSGVAASEGVGASRQIRVKQLGRAHGGTINDGVGLQIALLVFIGVFIASYAAWLLSGRLRDRVRGRPPAARSLEADATSNGSEPSEPPVDRPHHERDRVDGLDSGRTFPLPDPEEGTLPRSPGEDDHNVDDPAQTANSL